MTDSKNQSKADAKKLRKPMGNFFIKKSLQIRLIIKIVIAALISSVVSSGALLLVYYLRYKTTVTYVLDIDTDKLEKGELIWIVLPALAISAAVSVAVAFGIGLYASRKYAVPIFKIEQWVARLREGKMTANLRFREYEEMKELSQECNKLGAFVRDMLLDIRNKIKTALDAGVDSPKLQDVLIRLERMELQDKKTLAESGK